MAELNNFDATRIEPATGAFEPLPNNDYLSMIVNSEMKETKDGKGRYLSLTFEILDDNDYKGRRVFEKLNLVNASEKTVEIAQRTLSAICRAVGVLHPKDSAELHNKPLVISVGIKDDKQYGPKNVIKKYYRTDGKELTDITDTTPVKKVASAAAPAAKKKPWQR